MNKQPCVYILSSQKNGTLYIGVTSVLVQRIGQHRSGLIEGFAQKHNVRNLVYYELHDRMEDAIIREKQLKKWKRQWKIALIERDNKEWHDLYDELF